MTILRTDGYYKFIKTVDDNRGIPTHNPYELSPEDVSTNQWCVVGYRWMKSRQAFSKTAMFIWFCNFEEITEAELPKADSAVATKRA